MRWRLMPPTMAFVAATLIALPASADPGSVASAQNRAQQVLSQINALDSEVNKAAEAYNAANLRFAQIKRSYRENHEGLLIARKNLRRAQDALAKRLVGIYTSGAQDSTIAIFLGSVSFDDLLNRIEVQNAVTRQDQRLRASVSRYAAQTQRRQRQLAKARQDQVRVVGERAARRATIGRQLSERRALLASVRTEIARIQARERVRQLAITQQARDRLAANPPTSSSNSGVGVSASTPEGASVAPPATHGNVVAIAMRYLGVPYVWGGASPRGFDCSGFTMYVYAQIGISLPHYTGSQYAMGVPVARSDLQPGDLVFFDGLGHEGLYIGGNQFIHAPHTGDVVKISSISGWYASMYVGARRIL
jgi:cell wall-associated NlpC family hydrolase